MGYRVICDTCKSVFEVPRIFYPISGKMECPKCFEIRSVLSNSNIKERKDSLISEYGTSTGVSFVTSEGIKKMEPGKSYDINLNEI